MCLQLVTLHRTQNTCRRVSVGHYKSSCSQKALVKSHVRGILTSNSLVTLQPHAQAPRDSLHPPQPGPGPPAELD